MNLDKEIRNFIEKDKDLDNRLLELKNNFENEYSTITDKFDNEERKLDEEHQYNIKTKQEEIERQSKDLDSAINLDSNNKIKLIRALKKEEKDLEEKFQQTQTQLNKDIEDLQEKLKVLEKDILDNKDKLMEANDKAIFDLRKEMEGLKIEFYENERIYALEKKKIEDEISGLRKKIQEFDTEKIKITNDVEKKRKENENLKKTIDDHISEINEKKAYN